MRILFLTQVVPYPLDAGPKVRIYHVLEHLAQSGHDITLVTFSRKEDRTYAIDHLHNFCSKIYTVLMSRSRFTDALYLTRSLLDGKPFLISRDHVRGMHQLISTVVTEQSFDVIHADQLWMAQYALAAKRNLRQTYEPRLVLDQHNATYLIPRRLADNSTNPLRRAMLNWESENMVKYEVGTCQLFDHVVWVTKEDRWAVAEVANNDRNFDNDPIIPICVDPNIKGVVMRLEKANRVTFLGGLHWPPNVEGVTWFIHEVWPMIQQEIPETRLTVIGKNPPRALVSEASRASNIELTGYQEDVTAYLEETAAFIVPLNAGGGMRVKILDAWSWGMPVISTSVGAEGLRCSHGKNILIADDPQAFSEAVISLVRNPELASLLSASGRETVISSYNWHTVYQAWEDIYSF